MAGDVVRVGAVADIHYRREKQNRLKSFFEEVAHKVDILLLGGDLTDFGLPDEAEILAKDLASAAGVPVVAVLGNHDFHAGKERELVEVLRDSGVTVLHRDWTVLDMDHTEIGIVGTKGFVGGFPGSTLPDFGEPLLRQVYAETTAEQEALAEGLRCVAQSDLRIVLLHYAPIEETVADEPLGIHAFLGSSRLGIPIAEYPPDIVLHGHAHMGRFQGRIGDVPVYNVAVHVTGRDFWIFDLEVAARGRTAVEVE
jgi:uncharacterized protein